MENNKKSKLSVDPYKGTRDFYPEEQFIQNYIFSVWKKVVESYGYLQYNASILEETDLYKAKSGDEIVNEQTYSFVDRGGREVTIRPEMTPTVARMVAQKRKELTFPLRWYSVPNLFRYERPQRGRLREHWQLNVDIFGIDEAYADIEILELAYEMMLAFGATEEQFIIKINHRGFTDYLFKEYFKLNSEQAQQLGKVLDRKGKISVSEFNQQAGAVLGSKLEDFLEILNTEDLRKYPQALLDQFSAQEILNIINVFNVRGRYNINFDLSIMRGFDYYTGIVFEMYDTSPVNPRALFGGGRYDDLVGIFGVEKVSGMGFGWGDVTTRDFLETYSLLPEYRPVTDLYVCHTEGFLEQAQQLASELRAQGLNVAVDLTERKVSGQVKTADREKIPFILVVGEDEVKSGNFKVKSLRESKENTVRKEEIVSIVKQ